MTNNNKPRFSKSTISSAKRLFSYIRRKHLGAFIFVMFAIVVSAVAGVAGSLFLQVLIDDYITPLLTMPNPVFDELAQAILTMAAIYLLGVVATYVYNRTMVVIAQGVLKDIRDEMFVHMQKMPISYFDTHTHGDTMSRYTNDTDTLRQMLAQSFPQIISSIFTIVTVFFAMLTTSWILTIVVMLTVLFMLRVAASITGKSAKYFFEQQQSLGKTNGYIEEMINGQRVVKVFCHEEESKVGFNELNEELCHASTQANRFANFLMPFMGNMGYFQYVLLAIVGGALAVSGVSSLTLGALVAFLQLSRSFTMPVSQVSQQLNAVVMALAGAQRIFELMDENLEVDEGYVTLINARWENNELVESEARTGLWAWKHPHHDGTTTLTQLKGDVVFDHVDFSYTPDKQILYDISLYAKPGQKVAFVGATGAGKTTITNLINRFYDIADGKIRYDGININKIKKADLRRSLGIVLQDTNLFTGTVMENIRYGNLNATDEEVIEAAKRANADYFISLLPEGYHTRLEGDASGLSQGQRQLLSIARAEVADTPVMILDEATSSIDTRTEAIVSQGMDALMEGRTVFVIAHRISTVQNSNAIMVMDQGRIIERGDHDELIAVKGKYHQLYTGAFEEAE
ncbi:ABC transporter ATP-binding protein [Eubacteriaceae bacterium ES3]|nr:ABC transporter ATP-binding protein [Eubacteriaceae bacterium ES3]